VGTTPGVPDRERDVVKKFLGWIAVLVILYVIANDPDSATRLVSGTIDLISRLADGATAVIDGV
jgi:hypothetical protein